MATKNLFVLFLLLRSVLSLPVSSDIKSVQSSDNVAVELTFRTIPFHTDTILSRDKDIEQVKRLDSVNFDAGVKKTKRETIKGNHSCAQGMKWILNNCVTYDKYNASKDDDYEITALPEDEGTTMRSRTTTRPGATLQPGPTAHSLTTLHRKPTPIPQTTSRLKLTPQTLTTLHPELSLQTLTTPRPELTTHSQTTTPRPEASPLTLTNKSSKQDHTSSLMYLVAAILVHYQIWCQYRTIF